ncbi:MAG: enoyl-CoA hydratase/isomerase family protein, partial [Bdellovibrionales bacterium]|nr:enoyl-CoA hydratase/isomerase family protein [Bdellovibrionales bacterium]
MSKFISVERLSSGVIEVMIKRADALNALNREVLSELKGCLSALSSTSEVRVVILRGEGDKAFVAGADIKEMQSMSRSQAADFSRLGHEVCLLLEQMPKVTIAAVQGFALGGGTELALACDFIMASERAQFGLPEVSLGVIPGFGGTIRLQRVMGIARAKELLFSGERIKAAEAKELGLIRSVHPQEAFFDTVRGFATRIAGNSLQAVIAAKRLMNEFEESKGIHPKVDA